MFIITYREEARFSENDLVELARRTPKFRQLHPCTCARCKCDLLQVVCADARVQLAVRHDLVPWGTQAATRGAPALAANVTICVAVLRRLTPALAPGASVSWSYRTTMQELNVNAGWRWVCQLYLERVQNFRTIQEREAKLQPKTIRLIHEVVVEWGTRLGVTQARKLRLDGSVTETNIHYPTDSGLLDDAARVLSRLVKQARHLLQPRSAADKIWFRDRHRQAHHLARDISRLSRSKAKNTAKSSRKLYKRLLAVVQALLQQVAEIQPRLSALKDSSAEGLKEELDHYLPLVERVIQQTQQRVLYGKPVVAGDKVLSLFEPHTALICRGKAKPKETEFGRKIWYAEVDGGLISEYRLLKGNPNEAQFLVPSVQHHCQMFGKIPQEVCGDRGIHSPENEQQARALGVRHVSLPQRFRNGIEGRISQLPRARHLDRCLAHGEVGMERWIGWGVIANNLATIAQFLIKHHRYVTLATS